jgi:hypothetical protein
MATGLARARIDQDYSYPKKALQEVLLIPPRVWCMHCTYGNHPFRSPGCIASHTAGVFVFAAPPEQGHRAIDRDFA